MTRCISFRFLANRVDSDAGLLLCSLRTEIREFSRKVLLADEIADRSEVGGEQAFVGAGGVSIGHSR